MILILAISIVGLVAAVVAAYVVFSKGENENLPWQK